MVMNTVPVDVDVYLAMRSTVVHRVVSALGFVRSFAKPLLNANFFLT